MDFTAQIDAEVEVGVWGPRDTVRVQVGQDIVDLSPEEVEYVVAWLEACREEATWRRREVHTSPDCEP